MMTDELCATQFSAVVSDQQIEIARMNSLRRQLATTATP
jgi:hypothetical protein